MTMSISVRRGACAFIFWVCAGLVLPIQTAQADDPDPQWVQTEEVDCSSLPGNEDRLAAGFGKVSPMKELQFHLIMDGSGRITDSTVDAVPGVIWRKIDNSDERHVYANQGVDENNEFYAEFIVGLAWSGSGGNGGSGVSKWYIDVADIDLDCDSDNDAQAGTNRAPSRSALEETKEDVDPMRGGDSAGLGMILDPSLTGNDRWAKLELTLRVRADGRLSVSLPEGINGDLELSETIEDPTIVSSIEENITLSPGDQGRKVVERTYYVRAKEGVTTLAPVRISARFTPSPTAVGQNCGIAEDTVLVGIGQQLRMYINDPESVDDDFVPVCYKPTEDVEKSEGEQTFVQAKIDAAVADEQESHKLFEDRGLNTRVPLTIKLEGEQATGDVTVLLAVTGVPDERVPEEDRPPLGALRLWKEPYGGDELDDASEPNDDKKIITLNGDNGYTMIVYVEAMKPGEVQIEATATGVHPAQLTVPLLHLRVNLNAVWGRVTQEWPETEGNPIWVEVFPSQYKDKIAHTLRWKYAEYQTDYPGWSSLQPQLEFQQQAGSQEITATTPEWPWIQLVRGTLGVSNKYGDMKMLLKANGILCDYKDFMVCVSGSVQTSEANPQRGEGEEFWKRTAPSSQSTVVVARYIFPKEGFKPAILRPDGISPMWIDLTKEGDEGAATFSIEAFDYGDGMRPSLKITKDTKRNLSNEEIDATIDGWKAWHVTKFFTKIGNLGASDEVIITENYSAGSAPTVSYVPVRGHMAKLEGAQDHDYRCADGYQVVLRAIPSDTDTDVADRTRQDTFEAFSACTWSAVRVGGGNSGECLPTEGPWTTWVPAPHAGGVNNDYFADVTVNAKDDGILFKDTTEGVTYSRRFKVFQLANLKQIRFSHTITVGAGEGAPAGTQVTRAGSHLEVLGGGQTITVTAIPAQGGDLLQEGTTLEWFYWDPPTEGVPGSWKALAPGVGSTEAGEDDTTWTLPAKAPGDGDLEAWTIKILGSDLPQDILSTIAMVGLNEVKIKAKYTYLNAEDQQEVTEAEGVLLVFPSGTKKWDWPILKRLKNLCKDIKDIPILKKDGTPSPFKVIIGNPSETDLVLKTSWGERWQEGPRQTEVMLQFSIGAKLDPIIAIQCELPLWGIPATWSDYVPVQGGVYLIFGGKTSINGELERSVKEQGTVGTLTMAGKIYLKVEGRILVGKCIGIKFNVGSAIGPYGALGADKVGLFTNLGIEWDGVVLAGEVKLDLVVVEIEWKDSTRIVDERRWPIGADKDGRIYVVRWSGSETSTPMEAEKLVGIE